ncbi:MAG: prepilin-type N-terminal cleavage/methylation domain-containing protein [Xanthobacteraceae bacterium]|nr:prepilin-type N-terminal cleavage/methylation domain-containing protein [Xanthobacteraceae bacterium]
MNSFPLTHHGFTLLETVCVMAIIAMLAAVLLPLLPRATSRPRLEAYAMETAALLNRDRTAAIRTRVPVSTQVDGRAIRSGSSSRIVRIPDDVAVDAVLPQRCADAPTRRAISFFATGTSCGGTITLSRLGAGYEVRVNWVTGGIEIVPRRVL